MVFPTLLHLPFVGDIQISSIQECLGLVCLTGKSKVGFQDDEPKIYLI